MTLYELVEIIESKARISLNFLNRRHQRGFKVSFALKTKTTYLLNDQMVRLINQYWETGALAIAFSENV